MQTDIKNTIFWPWKKSVGLWSMPGLPQLKREGAHSLQPLTALMVRSTLLIPSLSLLISILLPVCFEGNVVFWHKWFIFFFFLLYSSLDVFASFWLLTYVWLLSELWLEHNHSCIFLIIYFWIIGRRWSHYPSTFVDQFVYQCLLR